MLRSPGTQDCLVLGQTMISGTLENLPCRNVYISASECPTEQHLHHAPAQSFPWVWVRAPIKPTMSPVYPQLLIKRILNRMLIQEPHETFVSYWIWYRSLEFLESLKGTGTLPRHQCGHKDSSMHLRWSNIIDVNGKIVQKITQSRQDLTADCVSTARILSPIRPWACHARLRLTLTCPCQRNENWSSYRNRNTNP